ncbi:hypothetical protein P168DRAFT_187605 [Aspergillus campestris IBT 28561]|uniref:Uncharacterized protein n=1 Tax=Aspergillus campestris (strain IBT 28561) TaxID=1392248 RepID=A0A2I1CYA8_ASPC2|nr:uncharacterized protein P168DRAFT_187605 [Aspergillus campestris IBT 28561]PKY02620.1 hypothetical protein P168DRAFT_187605 [Aspergillus campestris IBT 28561]
MPVNRSRWQWSTRSKATTISRCGWQPNSRRRTEGVQTGVFNTDDDLQSPRNWPSSDNGSRWPSAPPSSSLQTKMRPQRQVSSPTSYTWNPIMFVYQRCRPEISQSLGLFSQRIFPPIFLVLSLYYRQIITGVFSDYFGPTTGRAIDVMNMTLFSSPGRRHRRRVHQQAACSRVSFFATSAAAAVLICGIQPLQYIQVLAVWQTGWTIAAAP